MKKILNIKNIALYFGMLWCPIIWAAPPAYVVDQALETQAKETYDLEKQMYSATQQSSMATQTMSRVIQSSLTGNSGIGTINNPNAEQNFRNWTPSSEDLTNMVAQGLQTGSLSDQIKYYNGKFKIPSAAQLSPENPNSASAEYGVFSAVSTNAALSIADKSFDNVIQIQQQINFLYKELDRQRTLKQSQDFNSVIMLKIAAFQADLIRLQSQQLKMQALAQQENNMKRIATAGFIQNIH